MSFEFPQGAADVLDRNLPCDGCRYNLRGLEPSGRCPECGLDIASSLAADARRRRRLLGSPPLPPSPWFAREVVEGAGASLCALVLACLPGLAPHAWLELHTPSRAVMMFLLAAAWGLTLLSVWKLTRTDVPAGEEPGFGRWIARCIAVGWLSGAFYFGVVAMNLPKSGPPIESWPLYGSALCGDAVAALFLLRVGRLFGRAGRRGPMFLAYLLAALTLVATLAIQSGRGYGPSSFDLLTQAPLPPYVSAELLAYVPHAIAERDVDGALLLAAVGVVNAALLARLIVAYLPRTRRPAGDSATASA